MKTKLTYVEKRKEYEKWQTEIAAKIKQMPWYKHEAVEVDGNKLLN